MSFKKIIIAAALAAASVGAQAAGYYMALPVPGWGVGAGGAEPEANPFALHANGVTITCAAATPGDRGEVAGVEYLAVDDAMWRAEVAKTSGFEHICTTHVTNMRGAGSSPIASAYVAAMPVSHWDTGNVLDMSGLFAGQTAFNQPLGAWDTSSVTNMGGMFYMASAFNQPIGAWTVNNVTRMSSMFFGAAAFNRPIGEWDTSNLQHVTTMFREASSFNQPIGGWDVRAAVGLNRMFENAVAFNQNLSCWDVERFADEPMLSDFFSINAPIAAPNLPRWGQAPNTGC